MNTSKKKPNSSLIAAGQIRSLRISLSKALGEIWAQREKAKAQNKTAEVDALTKQFNLLSISHHDLYQAELKARSKYPIDGLITRLKAEAQAGRDALAQIQKVEDVIAGTALLLSAIKRLIDLLS